MTYALSGKKYCPNILTTSRPVLPPPPARKIMITLDLDQTQFIGNSNTRNIYSIMSENKPNDWVIKAKLDKHSSCDCPGYRSEMGLMKGSPSPAAACSKRYRCPFVGIARERAVAVGSFKPWPLVHSRTSSSFALIISSLGSQPQANHTP